MENVQKPARWKLTLWKTPTVQNVFVVDDAKKPVQRRQSIVELKEIKIFIKS